MTAEPSGAGASTATLASNPPANSEEVARLYIELANFLGSNDCEAVRPIYRELLRLGRPRMEILAEVARVAAAQEPKPIASGSLAKTITPIEVVATAAAHSRSRPSIQPASAGPELAVEPERQEKPGRFRKKHKKGFRLPRLNMPPLLRALAACFTPLSTTAATAILITLKISAVATPYAPTQEATALSIQTTAATPSRAPAPQSIKTPSTAEPAKSPEHELAPHLSAVDLAILRARGDALLSTGDVTASRLFYERAVAAGDAQAAIRLGATYDPGFLSQAHLQTVRSDMAVALSWYRRARDLGAVEAESLLRSIEGE